MTETATDITTAAVIAEQKVHDFAQGLRELADWLDGHADNRLIQSTIDYRAAGDWYLNVYCSNREEFAEVARLLGSASKDADENYFRISRQIGPVRVYGYTDRQNVCRRVVKGVKSVEIPAVEARAAQPARIEEREIVEWVCDDAILKPRSNEPENSDV